MKRDKGVKCIIPKIYEEDLNDAIRRLAYTAMRVWVRENDALLKKKFKVKPPQEIFDVLFKKAFFPKMAAKLLIRIKGRGHTLERGASPVERLSSQRHRRKAMQ